MNGLILIIAGLLEVSWAVGLKYSDGFTKPIPSIFTIIAMAASFYCLSIAMRAIPLSIAYTVWVGIGMIGTVTFSVIFLDESINAIKIISLLLLVSGIVGLKLSSVA